MGKKWGQTPFFQLQNSLKKWCLSPFLMLNKSGSILFVALWGVFILSIFAVGITGRIGAEMRLAKYLKDRLASLYLAKAALSRAALELEKDQTPDDSIYEIQKERTQKFGNAEFNFKFIDEESLININTASQTILEHLPGLNSELAKKIAESPLKPFTFKEELLLVEEVTKEIFLGLKDLITTYGGGKVNINTASPEILKICGLGDATVDTILDYRRGEDGQELTEDDKAYAVLPADVPPNLFTTATNYLGLRVETKISQKPVKSYYIVLEQSNRRLRFWVEK